MMGIRPNFDMQISTTQLQKNIHRWINKGRLNLVGLHYYISSIIVAMQESKEKDTITDATLVINGSQVKKTNSTCLILTIIGAFLLCFPWLFFLCDWWKRRVWSGYQVPLDLYPRISILLKLPSLKRLNLVVTDNSFYKQKADCLYQMLSKSSIQTFNFSNMASGLNWTDNNKQQEQFKENMMKIKSIPNTKSEMKWKENVIL